MSDDLPGRLLDDPEDPDAWRVHADPLLEQDDPRGALAARRGPLPGAQGVRTFFGVGREDALFPDPATLEALARPLGGEVRVIDGLGHDIPTDPETVEAILRVC